MAIVTFDERTYVCMDTTIWNLPSRALINRYLRIYFTCNLISFLKKNYYY